MSGGTQVLEAEVLKHVRLALSKLGSIMFRQNVGQAWAAKSGKVIVKGTSVFIEDAMPVTMGLFKGSGDLIGWMPMFVTQEMVGKQVAVFTSIEVKRTTGGRTSKEQKNWVQVVKGWGGIAGIANSAEAAEKIVTTYREGLNCG